MFGIAQAEFKKRCDKDGSAVSFWRRDVAGLYRNRSKDGRFIELIPKEAALADAQPTEDLSSIGKRAPWIGYWLQAISNEGEKNTSDPDRFAFCAYPAHYEPGRVTYIINENATFFRKDLGREGGVDVFPSFPQDKGWIRND